MSTTQPGNTPAAANDAEPSVERANAEVQNSLPFHDRQDFADAARGFLGTRPDALIRNASGRVVWNLKPYEFLQTETPSPTVNPSLWRQARLNLAHGLFRVVDRVYQVRGFDIANMTLIEGDSGLIVIDTLTSAEGAKAALELYFAHRGKRAVATVIYTHTHADHWGGVKGVVAEADVLSGKIPVIASWNSRYRRTSLPETRCCVARNISSAAYCQKASEARSIAGSAKTWRRAR
jgi:alkyl sulfatase BDS1-like metallo-beta-lactamase superfamily hydrolase